MDLDSPVTKVPNIGPSYANKLENLGIETVEDLLMHVPTRYLDFRKVTSISRVQVGETYTVQGEVTSLVNQYTKRGREMQIVRIEDASGAIECVWFNQKYLLKTIKKGTEMAVAGEISWFGRKKAIVSPEYEIKEIGDEGVHTGRMVPIYSQTKGITSKWLRGRVKKAYELGNHQYEEFLPNDLLKSEGLIGYKDAIENVHFPENENDVETGKKRLAFNELLLLQLKSRLRKVNWKEATNAHEIAITKDQLKDFTSKLPFELTKSQKRSIDEILVDLEKPYPMNRLLEGDVGSGKTVVAAAVCYASFANGYQSVIMAPTQILVTQHFNTLKSLLEPFGMKVAQITSATKTKQQDKYDVIVGTHALLFNKIDFEKVASVIIDEQHRFGVGQRAKLVRKTKEGTIAPDVLTMTATPIPRTVALTAYGDLDLSVLDELPGGRKKITTWITPENKRGGAYEWIEEQMAKDNVQAYVVCPLIEESEAQTLSQVKAVTVEFENIKKAFSGRKVGLLHGKMKAKEKDEVLMNFKDHKLDILVSTPVIEVGIDVPNATIMVIEAAERFGLAQLHQLRGRVGRGDKKSYCILFPTTSAKMTNQRLSAIKQADNGFELAELDLKLRGPGEIFGTAQSGFPELKVASWQNNELINLTQRVTEKAINNPNDFTRLYDFVKEKQKISN